MTEGLVIRTGTRERMNSSSCGELSHLRGGEGVGAVKSCASDLTMHNASAGNYVHVRVQ